MKKALLFLGILLLSFQLIKAQKTFVGFELGSNLIQIDKSDLGVNYHLTPYAGVNVKYKLFENVSLNSGLFFAQRKKMYFASDTSSIFDSFETFLALTGSSMNLDSLINVPGLNKSVYKNTTGIVSENYLELPIMVSYNYKNISVSAGLYFGFLIGSFKKEEIRTTTPLLQAYDVSALDSSGFISSFLPPEDSTTFIESSSTENLQKLNKGAVFGLGYEMNNVKFNLNYTLGFNDYRIDQGEESKNSHKSIRLSVIYYFNVSKNKETAPSLE